MILLNNTPVLPTTLDVASVLYSINNLEAWYFILGNRIPLREKFSNPFRSDKNPSAFLDEYEGYVYMHDFASPQFHGIDFIEALQYVYPTLDFYKRIYQFLIDFGASTNMLRTPPPTKSKGVPVTAYLKSYPRVWQLQDKLYWEQFEISRANLESENVAAIESFTFSSKKSPSLTTIYTREPAYAIRINNREKVYRPYADKKHKWISSLRKEDIGGKAPATQNILWLTKSYKDYQVVLNQGFHNRYVTSENTIPYSFLTNAVRMYDLIIPLMDNDMAGVRAAKNMERVITDMGGKAFGCYLPSDAKDPAEFINKYGSTELTHQLNNLKQQALCLNESKNGSFRK